MELNGLLSTIMPPPAATFDPKNLINMPLGPVTCDLILVKLAPVVTKIFNSPGFWVTTSCDLDL